jgi:hypothetical protein
MFTDDQLQARDIDTLKRWLRVRLGGYVVAVKPVPAQSLVYRGVSCPTRPDTIKSISYPPADRVRKLQRLNREGQPRFYCSAAAPAVFFELNARVHDLIALSEWEVTESLWMHNLGYHHQVLQRIGSQPQNIAGRRALTHAIPNETAKNEKLRRALSDAFTCDVHEGIEYRYKQSIAIIESMSDEVKHNFDNVADDFPRRNKIAGAVYPSMRLRGDADNLMFLPEFVDSSLRVKTVRYVRVEAADEAASSYTLLTVGFADRFSGDLIEWNAENGPEESRRSYIAFEGGHWILRNGAGQIYECH